MTLNEAIKHCEEIATGTSECAVEHKQLAEWLKELEQYQKQKRKEEEKIDEMLEVLSASTKE